MKTCYFCKGTGLLRETRGAPRKGYDEAVMDLRNRGMTIQKIADQLKTSVGSVHRAIKRSEKEDV